MSSNKEYVVDDLLHTSNNNATQNPENTEVAQDPVYAQERADNVILILSQIIRKMIMTFLIIPQLTWLIFRTKITILGGWTLTTQMEVWYT